MTTATAVAAHTIRDVRRIWDIWRFSARLEPPVACSCPSAGVDAGGDVGVDAGEGPGSGAGSAEGCVGASVPNGLRLVMRGGTLVLAALRAPALPAVCGLRAARRIRAGRLQA